MLPSLSSSSNYKSTWSSAEDELLLKAVSKWGPHDWYQIAIEMPGRLPRQSTVALSSCVSVRWDPMTDPVTR